MHPSEVIKRTIGAMREVTQLARHTVINIPTCHMDPLLVMMPGSAFIREIPGCAWPYPASLLALLRSALHVALPESEPQAPGLQGWGREERLARRKDQSGCLQGILDGGVGKLCPQCALTMGRQTGSPCLTVQPWASADPIQSVFSSAKWGGLAHLPRWAGIQRSHMANLWSYKPCWD